MNEAREGEYPDIIKWEKVNDKVWDKVLWSDEKTGSYVRLVRGDPGFEGKETLISYFPAGTDHGPFASDEGIACIEFRFYSKD